MWEFLFWLLCRRYYNIFYLTTCSDLVTERRILTELCPPLRAEVVIR